jgi:uncharacterized membrane protein
VPWRSGWSGESGSPAARDHPPVSVVDDEEQHDGESVAEASARAPFADLVARGIDAAKRFLRTADGKPFTLLAAIALLWVIVFSWLVVLRHERYGSFDFDAGIFGQAAWLSAHASQFDTVRGLPLFGHHGTFGFYLFAPFYWVGLGGPNLMNIAQVLALGAIPLVVYWVARRLALEPWIAWIAGIVCLLHFAMSWLAQELFHPEVFAIAPLLAAYGFALREQQRPYWVMLGLAVIWKEDVALAIIGLGALLLLQRHRRRGLYTMAFGFAWFIVMTQLVVPAFSPTGEAFYAEGFYGDLGDNLGGIGWSFVAHPGRVAEHLDNADAFGYVRDLWAPFAFVNLLAPATLLIGLPQLLANLLSVHGFTWDLRFHYVALPLMASMLGFVLGLRRLRNVRLRSFAAGLALAAALATTLSWGVGPYSRHYRSGYWPLQANSEQAELDHAISLVPGGAPVSASYHLVPHLTDRHEIYSFPNPFRPRNWGIDDEETRDPDGIEWIVVNRNDLGEEDTALLDDLLAESDFEVVYEEGNALVARREE